MLPVAKLILLDTFGRGIGPAFRTDEFVLWTSDGRAIGLISAVCAILVTVAVPSPGNTSMVLATELTAVARGEI